MNRLLQQGYEKIGFALALVAAAWSAGWFWREQAVVRKLQREPTRAILTGPAYVPVEARLPETGPAVWSKAPAQTRGGDWLYEVFTPPGITYDPGTRSFVIAPTRVQTGPLVAETRLELLAVKREPYRLQLVGYFGGPGEYLAAFASSRSPETLLARPGRRFESLGLTLKDFEVRKVAVGNGELGPAHEVVAFAVVQEDNTGVEVVLDSRTRKLTDTPLAIFQLPGDPGQSRELREGDSFADANSRYRIERIQLDPPEVVVARTAPDRSSPEIRLLRPADQVAGREVPPKPLVSKATADVAHNEQTFPSP